jgi:hypothetical protein
VINANFSSISATVNWDILTSGYFGGFLSKCGCLILVCLIFGAFQKMIGFILVLFKWLEKINARDQCLFLLS